MKQQGHKVYFYSIEHVGTEVNFRQGLQDNIGNTKGYKISQLRPGVYGIETVKEINVEIAPKVLDTIEKDLNDDSHLTLPDNKNLFEGVYLYVDFNCEVNFLNNCIGIVGVVFIGKENLSIIDDVLQKILSGTIDIKAIRCNNQENYLKPDKRKVKEFSFTLASANSERRLNFNQSEVDSIDSLLKLKDALGGNDIKFILKNTDGLDKPAIRNFFKNNQNDVQKVAIRVDELGNEVTQQMDKMRYTDLINLKITDKVLDNGELWKALEESYNKIMNDMRADYLVS